MEAQRRKSKVSVTDITINPRDLGKIFSALFSGCGHEINCPASPDVKTYARKAARVLNKGTDMIPTDLPVGPSIKRAVWYLQVAAEFYKADHERVISKPDDASTRLLPCIVYREGSRIVFQFGKRNVALPADERHRPAGSRFAH